MQMVLSRKRTMNFETSVPFSLEFSSLDEMLRLIRLAPFTEKMPTSSLYKFQQKYYLVMDLIHFQGKNYGHLRLQL